MPDDWKTRLDQYFQRKKEQEEREKEQKTELERQRQQLEEDRKKKFHVHKFKCHIKGCNVHSNGPHYVPEVRASKSEGGFVEHSGYYDWERPTGLEKCKECGQWTCPNHIHKGICITDAQKYT